MTSAERLSGHLLAQLGGAETSAVGVDVLVEPRLQVAECAAFELGVEVADVRLRLLEELGRVERTKGVRGEVAHRGA